MNASKEEARKARAALESFTTQPGLSAANRARAIETVATFIDAAERKLPSEASYSLAEARRREAR